ncbi:Ninja-family protein AFP2 [Linum perenne]
MGEAEGSSSSSRRATMESLSLEINRYPRDLLTRFVTTGEKRRARTMEEEDEEDEIELNLGLSLGGRFGVDKGSGGSKLARSSSIAGSIPESFKESDPAFGSDNYPQLMRTSSLPTETEEEWRKRKEMQSLRRLEAKRRRSEKQRKEEKNWVSGRQGSLNSRSREGSQGSVESHGGGSGGGGGGGSSGGPALVQGRMNNVATTVLVQFSYTSTILLSWIMNIGSGESRSPGRNQSSSSQDPPGPNTTTTEKPENQKRAREIGTSAMEDMPCVFTIGDGPNGRRVEGILYKYGRGEEVRIMCVCHGSFLSPAEFVKHAGGSNVDHPLKHIVVNPSGPSFL